MEIAMVTPDFLMLLQLTNSVKNRAADAALMTDNDLHTLWVCYNHLFEFWSVAQYDDITPPPVH